MSTTLLAVDDSKTMRKVLEITFAGDTYRTVFADSAAAARPLLGAERPALVIIDANLPAGSGYELCQEIKGQHPSTLVLMLANKQQPYNAARGAADDHTDKPFDTQQLLDRVAALLKNGPRVAAPAAPAPVAPSPAAPPVRPLAPAATGLTPGAPPASARPRTATLAYGAASPAAPGSVRAGSPSAVPTGGTLTGQPAVSPPPKPVAPAARPPIAPAPAPGPAPAPVAAPRPAAPAAAPAPSPAPAPAAPVAAAVSAKLEGQLGGLGLTAEQVGAVLALSQSVVEQVVWEVVPVLAETIIREEIKRLTAD